MNTCVYVYYVRMYEYMNMCIYVLMYICMCIYIGRYVCMYVWLSAIKDEVVLCFYAEETFLKNEEFLIQSTNPLHFIELESAQTALTLVPNLGQINIVQTPIQFLRDQLYMIIPSTPRTFK